jgi:hypothetical protein
MAMMKKPAKKAMKKSAPKKAMKKAPAKTMMPPMQAPPTGSAPMGGGPMMKKGGKIKKYQNSNTPLSKATKDSSAYFKRQGDLAAQEMSDAFSKGTPAVSAASNKIAKADKNLARQKNKGKAGFDANGFPLKKNKMGGKMSKMSKKK